MTVYGCTEQGVARRINAFPNPGGPDPPLPSLSAFGLREHLRDQDSSRARRSRRRRKAGRHRSCSYSQRWRRNRPAPRTRPAARTPARRGTAASMSSCVRWGPSGVACSSQSKSGVSIGPAPMPVDPDNRLHPGAFQRRHPSQQPNPGPHSCVRAEHRLDVRAKGSGGRDCFETASMRQ